MSVRRSILRSMSSSVKKALPYLLADMTPEDRQHFVTDLTKLARRTVRDDARDMTVAVDQILDRLCI